VEKRRRLWAETLRPSAHEKVWEYQMCYGRWDGAEHVEVTHERV